MKSRRKSILSMILGLAGLGLLAFVGNWSGHKMARAGWFYRIPATEGSTATAIVLTDRAASEPVRKDEVASAIKRLHAIAKASPNLSSDWEASAQIDAILAKLNAAELAEVYASINPKDDYNLRVLDQKVGAVWMALEPDAALAAALVKGQYYAHVICGQWIASDPVSGLAWLKTAKLPEEQSQIEENLRVGAMINLVARDFDLATAELLANRDAAPGSDHTQKVLGNWAHLYVDEPAMRGRLVEFAKSTGHPEDYAALNSALLRSWPQEDALGMLTYLQDLRGYLESDAVPAEKRQETDATAVGAAIYREYTVPALEWWMERYSQSSETPPPLREAISYWIQRYPDAVQQWFDQQPDSPQRDAMNAAAVPAFISQGKFAEAARSIDGIRNPELRQPALERLDFVWTDRDPQAAAAWRDSRAKSNAK
jgi:hypothetical protein